MSAVDPYSRRSSELLDSIAAVRHQLEPIRSRRALIDSYLRESLCRLTISSSAAADAAEVLEAAYALRWLELEGSESWPETEPELPA
jgi:hypothetical protein